MSFVSRSEHDALERRVAKAEQALRHMDTQNRILQARLEGLQAGTVLAANGGYFGASAFAMEGLRDRSRSPRPIALAPPMSQDPGSAISAREFAAQNGLDDKCLEVLLNQPAEVQQYVIGMGPADGRNPSAMVMARIAKCTVPEMSGGGAIVGGISGSQNVSERVEDFIAMNAVDEKCAEALRTQTVPCQAFLRGWMRDDDRWKTSSQEYGAFWKAVPLEPSVLTKQQVEACGARERNSSHPLSRLLQKHGVQEHGVRGDGNCQFRALAHQLYGDEDQHAAMRELVVRQLEEVSDRYCGFVPGRFQDYVSEMSRDETWGDNVTLQAAADALGLRIHVLTDHLTDGFIEVIPQQGKSQKVLRITFWAEVHYNSVAESSLRS